MDMKSSKTSNGTDAAGGSVKHGKAYNNGDYLRGPISMDWLVRASNLPGSALTVGLSLWQLRALRKSMTFSAGIGDMASRWQLSHDTVRRALWALNCAGLIGIRSKAGSKNIITMLEHGKEKVNDQQG